MFIKRRKVYRRYSTRAQRCIKKYAVYLSLLVLSLPIAISAIVASPTQAADDGLIGEWRLDEGSGTTAADTSGNGNDGTIVQGTGTGSPAWASPGHDTGFSYALDFDGTGASSTATNSVNLGNSPLMDQMDDYTISLWVKFKPGYVGGDNTWANLVGRNSSGANWAWMIYVNGSGHIRPHHRNSNGTYAPLTDSAKVMPTGEWVHIEQVADGSNLHLYINGQEDANFPITYSGTTMSLPTANTYIGQDMRGNAPLATISDVKIYDNAEIAPQSTTGAATNVATTSATLNGTLGSLGSFTSADVFFRYRVAGSSDAYTETTPQELTATGPFSANISGLTADTEYEFAAVVQWQGRDGSQQAPGATANFETDPLEAPSAVTNLQAAPAGTSRINLSWNAPVDNGGSPITGYQIERSLNGTDWTTIVPTTGSAALTYENTGLNSNTEYFYRVSAINALGTGSPSNTASATTGTVAPQPTTGSATAITQTSATLNGSIDTLGDFTSADVFFRYRVAGSGDAYIATTPQELTAAGAFNAEITGLQPNAEYEFRAVVQWDDGGSQELEGNLATFTTSGSAAPDCDENNVDCFVNPTTGKNVMLEVDDACQINNASVTPESRNAAPDPDGFNYPAGLMKFSIDCGTAGYTTTIKQYYFNVTNNDYVLRKYNPHTNAYFTIDGATIEQTSLHGKAVMVATYKATDGGTLDVDGAANGTIVDPAGLALNTNDLADTGQNMWLYITAAALPIIFSSGVIAYRHVRYRGSTH